MFARGLLLYCTSFTFPRLFISKICGKTKCLNELQPRHHTCGSGYTRTIRVGRGIPASSVFPSKRMTFSTSPCRAHVKSLQSRDPGEGLKSSQVLKSSSNESENIVLFIFWVKAARRDRRRRPVPCFGPIFRLCSNPGSGQTFRIIVNVAQFIHSKFLEQCVLHTDGSRGKQPGQLPPKRPDFCPFLNMFFTMLGPVFERINLELPSWSEKIYVN